MEDRYIAVERPAPTQGVGRALQIAYRNGVELPSEMVAYLGKLDRYRY